MTRLNLQQAQERVAKLAPEVGGAWDTSTIRWDEPRGVALGLAAAAERMHGPGCVATHRIVQVLLDYQAHLDFEAGRAAALARVPDDHLGAARGAE